MCKPKNNLVGMVDSIYSLHAELLKRIVIEVTYLNPRSRYQSSAPFGLFLVMNRGTNFIKFHTLGGFRYTNGKFDD